MSSLIKSVPTGQSHKFKATPPKIYLTFDDAPYRQTEIVLTQLKSLELKATFFVNMSHLANDPSTQYQLLKRMLDEKHEIASHGYDHRPAGKHLTDPDHEGMYPIEKEMTVLEYAKDCHKYEFVTLPNGKISVLERYVNSGNSALFAAANDSGMDLHGVLMDLQAKKEPQKDHVGKGDVVKIGTNGVKSDFIQNEIEIKNLFSEQGKTEQEKVFPGFKHARLPGDGRFLDEFKAVLKTLNLKHVGWDAEFAPKGVFKSRPDFKDWKIEKEEKKARVKLSGTITNGSIVLFHDLHWNDGDLLHSLLGKLKALYDIQDKLPEMNKLIE